MTTNITPLYENAHFTVTIGKTEHNSDKSVELSVYKLTNKHTGVVEIESSVLSSVVFHANELETELDNLGLYQPEKPTLTADTPEENTVAH